MPTGRALPEGRAVPARHPHRRRLGGLRRAAAVATSLALLLGACTGDDGEAGGGSDDTVAATFDVRPGVEIATVTGAEPGHDLTLVDAEGTRLLTLVTDDEGQANFAYVPDEHLTYETGTGGTLPTAEGQPLSPGTYTIRDESADPVAESEPFDVMAIDDVPDESFYDEQEVGEGFGYVTTRDGVTLSVMVRLPGPIEDGPYPTVVEYSGYGPSNPGGDGEPGSMIAGLLGGYATVGVNMRGTGCSGGVFDVFSAAQQADGYDVIEAIARQPWVKGNRVGMVGLSYSGITQLYVAATRPPSLAAITPLSVIGDSWQMAWPGAIYNSGFTEQWLAERNRQSESGGSDWVSARVDEGDETCEDNLLIRSQNPDFGDFTRALEYRPDEADARDLETLVPNIEVPVYLTGAWQDEQTGPRFTVMLDDFTGTDREKITLFNGRHPDGYTPLVLTRWYEFLELYVDEQVPRIDDGVRALAPDLFTSFFGVEGLEFEPDRFPDFADDDLEGVLAAYEAEPKVRVLFENGFGDETRPGSPQARFEATFDEWPPPEAEAVEWYLGPDGTLVPEAPSDEGVDVFVNDPEAGQDTFFADDDGGYPLLDPLWEFDWQQPDEGEGLSYLTEPFTTDTVLAGSGYADLWVRADSTDADVQVTITEVRPDGVEYLVQSGQLRLSRRNLTDEIGDDLEVPNDFSEAGVVPLDPGEWARAQVAIPSFAQAFRAGTRLRVVISSPGHDRGTWKFDTIGEPGERREIGRGGEHASSIVLSTVTGIDVADGEPPCPSLRGQACRTYAALPNDAA
ncbi:MAG: CocE/NonD family hydrolase [Acidimicrobiales bacterium]|nr:CocE/NonD family hydrolase [Acidimicrobiales bacterium]